MCDIQLTVTPLDSLIYHCYIQRIVHVCVCILFSLEMRQRGRFAGFSLYVSNTNVTAIDGIKSSTLCYKDGPHLPPLNFTINCTAYGRYVIFFNERSNVGSYPSAYEVTSVYTELCEVFVKGKLFNIIANIS